MDIYLIADAVQNLRAFGRLASVKGNLGFLLGHRRSDRFFIESVLPSPSATWPSLQEFYKLDRDVSGKIIGFFIIGSAPTPRKTLLQPFGAGRVLIEINARSGTKTIFRGAAIDYETRFKFRPIPVIVETPSAPEKEK